MSVKLEKQQKSALLMTLVMAVGFAGVLAVIFLPGLEHVLNIKRIIAYALMLASFLVPVGVYFGVRRNADPMVLALVLLLSGAAIAARVGFFDYESSDYREFLEHWIHELEIVPGVKRWCDNLGDYNMPYIYLLTVIAKQPLTPLYMIKILSCAFDFMLAFYAMKLSSLWLGSLRKEIAVFAAVIFFPTVVINSAYWGQCDAIYSAFAVAGLYYSVTKRPYAGVAMFAVSFSFKLQAVFILPVLAVLLIARKIKIKHLAVFPVTFFALLTPAFIAGKPVGDALSIYVNQAKNYPDLAKNIPNLYSFMPPYASYTHFKVLGLFAAGAAVAAIIYFAWINRSYIDSRDICVLGFLCAVALPYILPKMHERYYFMADILSLTAFFANKKRWYIPLTMVFASIRAYSAFLIDADVNFRCLSLAILFIMSMTAYDLGKRIAAKRNSTAENKNENAIEGGVQNEIV